MINTISVSLITSRRGEEVKNKSFFDNKDYYEYLLKHCGTRQSGAVGRVAGLDLVYEILSRLNITKNQRVLEIGCGVGRIAHMMDEVFSAEVYGCDLNEAAISHLSQSFPDGATRFFHASSCDIPFSQNSYFDYVVTWGVFELTDQRRTLLEMSRLIKVGGVVLLGSVKNGNFYVDDEDSQKASIAYIEKNIPISYTDIPELESCIEQLGFSIRERMVFEYKKDLVAGEYTVDSGGDRKFAEAIYILEKMSPVAIDGLINISPAVRKGI